MPFARLNPALSRALAQQGYAEPTPVQAAVLEAGAGEADLLVSAQTGSGKTVAYGLALAPTLLGEAEAFGPAAAPMALIISPTRELALQVARELGWLYAEAGARIVTCVGGMDARREQRQLAAGAHIVVGTPGRLRDHLDRGALDLSQLRAAVLDEADEMLDLGFREDLEAMLEAAPAERRTLLFSATFAREIVTLARRYQRDAVRIDAGRRDEQHADIEYRALAVAPNEIERGVVNVLRYHEAGGALVFCGTREGVKRMYGSLRERGFAVVALSGELSQKERSDALQALRDGFARVCVATDVAARGLDLPDLGLVIHADIPVNKAGLLHRSGRTGRAGKKGVAVLMVPFNRRRRAEQLLASAGIEAAWGPPPSADEIRARDQARLLEDPLLTEPPTEDELAQARMLLDGRSAEQIAAALIRLRRQRLPAPEELFDVGRDFTWREPRPPREQSRTGRPFPTDTRWFRLNIGRAANADPKWLIPLICRAGHITKAEIGQIRILERETRFEISAEAAERFAAAVAASPVDKARISPAADPGPRERRPRAEDGDSAAPRKPWSPKGPRRDGPPPRKTGGKKPWSPRREKGARP